ncbi:hypothetical protein ABZT34_34460 [Streptomyces sp. NPDC005329]|uniref:hypothetical protein n=1 Tax=Streptomyces sp. NPDC005329 TaxID=3157034 RepID=UPI0033B8E22B
MPDNMKPVTPSATMHGERIRALTEQRAARTGGQHGGRQTAEVYAERAAAGVRADEALRERARLSELRALGGITPDPEPEEDVEDEYVEYEYEEDGEPEVETPKSTADMYAEREMARQRAERAATLAAHRSVGQAFAPPQVHRHLDQIALPYRRTPGGQNPAA